MRLQPSPTARSLSPRCDANSGDVPRILVVEDDARQRQLLSHMLEDRGYAVAAVGSAAAAIGALQGSFDLLVTDVDIGSRLTGLDIVRLLRSVRPQLPVIILSARDSIAYDGQGIVHLRKPCTSGVILAAVQQFAPLLASPAPLPL